MGQKQEISNARAIFALFAIVFAIGLILYTILFMFNAKNDYLKALNHANSTQTYAADTISKLYKYVKLPNSTKPFTVLPFEYSQPYGGLFLVNKTKHLDAGYSPKGLEGVVIPSYVGEGQILVRSELNPALTQMNESAKKDGLYLMVRSAYRSYAEQKQLKQLTGYSDTVADAGESEHQTGLAVDINSTSPNCGDICSLDSVTAAWLLANAPKYGFILRYPSGKEAKTGYPYESWHFRYVGVPVAQAIVKSSLTFDEAYTLITK